ncbi:MAG TPA: hypothetical protein VE570_04545, partial [Thermoleophilaceae bacterium]|nr:hypothetical protein [Thermoleophilaceae bacterium]
MSTYQLIADLPLTIGDYTLEAREVQPHPDFTRLTTTIHLRGGGMDGQGEDVTYDAEDHDRLQEAGPVQPLEGSWTLESFCDHLAALDLWPEPPVREPSRHYRVWAYESAALDLALQQARRSLADVVGREPKPVTFVMSTRLPDDPPTSAKLRAFLAK